MHKATNPSAQEQQAMERIQRILELAKQGDVLFLSDLREILDTHSDIWKRHGDLDRRVEEAWLQLIAGPDLLVKESVERKLNDMKAELSGPAPTPLEKLLVDRVTACWLQVHFADAASAVLMKEAKASPATLGEMRKRQESAERRFQAAIKQLALVRKLLRPAVSPLQLAATPVSETNGGIRNRGPRIRREMGGPLPQTNRVSPSDLANPAEVGPTFRSISGEPSAPGAAGVLE